MEETFRHIKIGDTLYKPEVSIGHKRIYRVVIEDIWFEEYLMDWRIMVQGHIFYDNIEKTIDCGTRKFFSGDILHMYATLNGAKNWIAAEIKKHPMLGRNQNEKNN